MKNTADIELVEWHDGILESIQLSGSDCVFRFECIYVYRKRGPELYDIERCRALLKLLRAKRVLVNGPVESSAWVDDCSFDGGNGTESVNSLLHGLDAKFVGMTLTNGSAVEVECEQVKLELQEPFEYFERWEGPLQST